MKIFKITIIALLIIVIAFDTSEIYAYIEHNSEHSKYETRQNQPNKNKQIQETSNKEPNVKEYSKSTQDDSTPHILGEISISTSIDSPDDNNTDQLPPENQEQIPSK